MLITNGKILREHDFEYYDLLIEGDRIAKILPFRSHYPDPEVFDARGNMVIPGMIDLEVHGALGYDVSDACGEAYQTISNFLLTKGVTSYVAALDAFPEEILAEACTAAGEWMGEEHGGAEMVGISLNGPFANPEAAGNLDRTTLRDPDPALYKKLQELSGGRIKMVMVSPELPGARQLIHEVSKDCWAALAHSAADFDTARMGFAYRAFVCADLFRNMKPFSVEDPGLIGAALDAAEYVTLRYTPDESIHPSLLRMAYGILKGRIALVSGQTAFTGLANGAYEIEGHTVTKMGQRIRFEDGTDAGSVTTLDDCGLAVMGMGAIPSPLVYRSSAQIPAKMLGIFDEVGSITEGKRADLAVMHLHNGIIQATIKNGKLVYDGRKNYD